MPKGELFQSFYRLPKFLFSDEYKNILSTDAKLLYALLLDRSSLSLSNGWLDSEGRVFIYFTVEEAADILGFGRDKIIRHFKQLEKSGLIERRRCGINRASVIYVNTDIELPDVANSDVAKSDVVKSDVAKSKKTTSRSRKNRSPEVAKTESNNTEYNKTEINNTELNNTYSIMKRECEIIDEVKEQIEYDYIVSVRDRAAADQILTIMTDILKGYAPFYRINNSDVPAADVRLRLQSLNEEHVIYVIDVLADIKGNVKNIRQYILNLLYNAPICLESYTRALINDTYN